MNVGSQQSTASSEVRAVACVKMNPHHATHCFGGLVCVFLPITCKEGRGESVNICSLLVHDIVKICLKIWFTGLNFSAI